MNSINKYCGYKKRVGWFTKVIERILYGKPKCEVIKPLHAIGFYPATMPAGWKGSKV